MSDTHDLEQHVTTWRNFTRLVVTATAVVVVVLVGLAVTFL